MTQTIFEAAFYAPTKIDCHEGDKQEHGKSLVIILTSQAEKYIQFYHQPLVIYVLKPLGIHSTNITEAPFYKQNSNSNF